MLTQHFFFITHFLLKPSFSQQKQVGTEQKREKRSRENDDSLSFLPQEKVELSPTFSYELHKKTFTKTFDKPIKLKYLIMISQSN